MQSAAEKKKALSAKKRKRFIVYLILLLFFLLLATSIIYTLSHNRIIEKRDAQHLSELRTAKERMISELTSVNADLIYYSQSELAEDTLVAHNQMAKSYLTLLMSSISSLQPCYDQVRLFDRQGNEIIRINKNPDLSSSQVPKDKLQNKSERYYFKNATKLSPKEIYVSRFDLNVENGRVEQPVKPMIRFSTSIQSDSGELIGVGTINYRGKRIFNLIDEIHLHKGEQVYLVNQDGYYLKGKNKQQEWSYMFPERKQFRFSDDAPLAWEYMQTKKNGKLDSEDGEYYFTQIRLSSDSSDNIINNETFSLIIYIPDTVTHTEKQTLINGILIGLLFTVPLTCFLLFKLSSSQVEQEWLIKELNFEATHDKLTGLYNRKAILDYLRKNIRISQRRGSPLSIGFIDVNDLKETNDNDGHEAGDTLIRGLAKAINLSIRESDFAARLGGDEFLILLIDCDKASADTILQRIQSIYALSGHEVGKKWSISFGCTELQGDKDSAETMVARADNIMYQQKARQKQNRESVDIKVNKTSLINIRTHCMDLTSQQSAVQSLDHTGSIIDVSPKWLHLTGYTREETIGRYFTEFLDTTSYKQVEENFPRIKGYGYVNNVPLYICCKNGTKIQVCLNGTSKYNTKGEFERTYCEITPCG